MFAATLNDVYLHAHGKIILFNSKQEIEYFVQKFIEYSMTKASLNGQLNLMASIMNPNLQIEEWTDKLNNSITCGTVTYDELRK